MKSIERQIVEIAMVVILVIGFIALCATSVTAQTQEKVKIRATSLSELIGSQDEVECFAFYFDTKPEIIEDNILDYRMVYVSELQKAGYKPKLAITGDFINFPTPFDRWGHIIKWSDFADANKHEWDLKPTAKVIGRHAEKVVFDHDIEE